VFAQGGFDAVIGNPPYGAFVSNKEINYLRLKYETLGSLKDVYICFIENGLMTLKENGILSFIVPSSWIGGPKYEPLREFLIGKQIDRIVLLPYDVFKTAYIDTLIFVISDSESTEDSTVKTFIYPKRERISSMSNLNYDEVKQSKWKTLNDKKFVLDSDSLKIISSLSTNKKLRVFRDVIKIKRGVYFDKSLLSDDKKNDNYHHYFEGQIYRYKMEYLADKWVEFSEKMKEKPKDFYWFEGKRILLRRLVNRRQRLMAFLVEKTFITDKNLYSILSKDLDIRLILGVLNSKLLSYLYINQVTQAVKDDFPQVTIRDTRNLPFPNRDLDKSKEYRVINLVDRIIEQNRLLLKCGTPNEKTQLQRQIDATDAEIDRLVYDLYGLTEEEIRIVEESVG